MTPEQPGATETNAPEPESGHSSTSARRHGPSRGIFIALGVAVLLAGAFAYFAVRHRDEHDPYNSLRATGIPASISTPLANEMALSPVPSRPAPNFTLVDQDGHTVSLASFTGRAVVLEFMDPHCTDICPIVSQEFIDAYRDLGSAASRVVFLGVNVNQYYAGVSDVATFSRDHNLVSIPSWHFLTGSVNDLKATWLDYGIEVDVPNPKADIIHTSVVYFIDPHGRERYIATPMDDHTAKGAAYLPSGPLASWGQGIALVTQQLTGK